jgi:hypothetical protein
MQAILRGIMASVLVLTTSDNVEPNIFLGRGLPVEFPIILVDI